MASFIDFLFIVNIILLLTKSPDLILRPHQRKYFNGKFESFTLLVDSLSPWRWFKSIKHELYYSRYLALCGSISFVIANIYSYKVKVAAPTLTVTELQVSTLLFMLFLSSSMLFLLCSVLFKVKSDVTRLMLFVAVISWAPGILNTPIAAISALWQYWMFDVIPYYPNLFVGARSDEFWVRNTVMDTDLGLTSTLAWGLVLLFSGFSIVPLAILLVTVHFQVLILVTVFCLNCFKALIWRIAEFDKGPFMGLLALLTVILGVTKFWIE